jgi:hypothetical protein
MDFVPLAVLSLAHGEVHVHSAIAFEQHLQNEFGLIYPQIHARSASTGGIFPGRGANPNRGYF